jgi:hypothetical protein
MGLCFSWCPSNKRLSFLPLVPVNGVGLIFWGLIFWIAMRPALQLSPATIISGLLHL